MNVKFRTACAVFASLAVVGGTIAAFAAPVSADPPVCQSICNFHIGYPGNIATGNNEVGLHFQSDVDGWIEAVCFWEAPTESGNHTVSLWDSSGARVATSTSAIAPTPGQESCVDFTQPVPITANAAYTASYTANTAFEVDPGQLTFGISIPPLQAPGHAGVTGAPGSLPTTSTPSGDGYGVDIAFVDTLQGLPFDCVSTLTAPTSPSSAPGNASATVSWGPASSNPAGCVAGYVVTAFSNGVAQTATLIPGAGTTTVISGLTNGQAYTFTIAAESGRLVGPASTVTGPVTVGSPTAASALHVTRVSNGALKVAFKGSRKSNGAAISKYTATCKPSAGAAKSKSGKASPLTVTGLSKGKAYRCSVRATNRRGTGPASKKSVSVKA